MPLLIPSAIIGKNLAPFEFISKLILYSKQYSNKDNNFLLILGSPPPKEIYELILNKPLLRQY